MKELHAANRRSVGCFCTGKLKGDIVQVHVCGVWPARRAHGAEPTIIARAITRKIIVLEPRSRSVRRTG
jgi:hypothetical protein